LPRHHHRRLLLAVLAAAFLLLALAPAALGNAITPESGGSPNANDIDDVYRIALYIAIVVFLVVEGTLIWSLVKFRARRGREAAQIRGNLPLEATWTIAAALILVVLTTLTFIYLNNIRDPEGTGPGGLAQEQNEFASVDQPQPPKGIGKPLNIKVNGQQYIWRFVYPGPQPLFSYYQMVVPTNTTVTLDITSSDVAHSWWIPKLGGKADAIPGHVNHTWFKIKKPGVYGGQCAELCGINHADMRASVRAVPPAEFVAWERRQRADILASQKAVAKQREQRLKSGQVD
jgi:cytochrome c oxidase subunit 2